MKVTPLVLLALIGIVVLARIAVLTIYLVDHDLLFLAFNANQKHPTYANYYIVKALEKINMFFKELLTNINFYIDRMFEMISLFLKRIIN